MPAKPFAACAAIAFVFGVAAAPLAFAAEPAAALPAPFAADVEQVSVTVPVSDLNMNRQPGAEAALIRLNSAANEACGDRNADLRRLRETAQRRACAKEAVDSAVITLDNPIVTALNAQQITPTTMLASRR